MSSHLVVAVTTAGAIVAGDETGMAHHWDGEGQPLGQWQAHPGPVECLLVTADEREVITSDDTSIIAWRLPAGEQRVVFMYQAERAFSAGGAMVLLAGGERILTGSTSNIGAREWSVADGRLKTVHFSEQCEAGAHTAVAADATGARVFVGDSDGGLWLWRLSPEYGLDAALMIDDAGGVADLAVTPDGAELFALGAGSGVLMAIDPSACEQVGTFATGSESVRSMTLIPDGTILVAGGAEGSLSFWDRASKELLVRVVGHDGPVVSLASSLDGRYAVSADDDGVIKRWDLDPLAADAGLTIVSRP